MSKDFGEKLSTLIFNSLNNYSDYLVVYNSLEQQLDIVKGVMEKIINENKDLLKMETSKWQKH